MTAQPSRTFADMTPEEINQCRGMWCEVDRLDGVYILLSISYATADLYDPQEDLFICDLPEVITPRFDLPRAWNPDGTPPTGTWEYDTIEFQSYPEARGVTDRRWVSDWEEVE